MLAVALTIVSTFAAVLTILVAWLAYRDAHRTTVRAQNADEVRNIVREEIQAFVSKQQEISNRTDGLVVTQTRQTQDLHELADRMGRVLDRLSVMETKIEVFWKSVAMDAAKIIHSPDPRRAHIDALLDAFTEGTITTQQASELKTILVFLRDWEPGKPADFPVYPGEQVAAAILLRTMDHAIPGGR